MQGSLAYLLPRLVFCLWPLLMLTSQTGLLAWTAPALAAVRGDVAPYGAPDGRLNIGDLVVVQQFLSGSRIPDDAARQTCDVAPAGAPDGVLDVGDFLVLERAVLGLITLDTVTVLLPPRLWGREGVVQQSPHFVSGLAQPGAVVRLYVDGQPVAGLLADERGLFSATIDLVAGATHTVYATQLRGEQESAPSVSLVVQLPDPGFIDRSLVTDGYDNSTYQAGDSAGDSLPDNIFLTGAAGSVTAGALVTVMLTDGSVWSAQANADGSFAVALAVYREEAGVMVRAADVAGISVGETSVRLAAAGAIAAQFEVDSTGAATYSIPIPVPPGTAGMAPKLSLDFNSNGGAGTLGRGWALGGLSVITRCPKSMARDGQPGRVNLDNEDRFCLDGQRLAAVSGAYGADSTEYRTGIESFTRVISYGGAGGSPQYFMAWTRAGEKIRYGFTPDSAFDPGGGAPLLWAADRVTDRQGNYFSVSYHEDQAAGEHYPLRIDYTANDSAGLAAYNSLQLVYESRPDPVSGYVGGRLFSASRRLAHIRTYAGSALVREYRLSYEAASFTGESLLGAVTECAPDAVGMICLQPTRFGWSAAVPGFMPGVASGTPGSGAASARGLDVNGDGRQDLLVPHDGRWWINYGDAAGLLPELDTGVSTAGSYPEHSQVIDYDADGRADLLVPGTDGYWDLLRPENGGLSRIDTPVPNGKYDLYPAVLDINGDGRQDLVLMSDSATHPGVTRHVHINSENGLLPALDTGMYRNGIFEKVVDYDNDGRQDLLGAWYVGYQTCEFRLFSFDGQDFSYEPIDDIARDAYGNNAGCLSAAWGEGNSLFLDVNGDGLQDLVYLELGIGGTWKTVLNTGRGLGFVILDTGLTDDYAYYSRAGDYNLDGRGDLFIPSGGVSWVVYQSTGSGFVEQFAGLPGSGFESARFMDVNGDGMQDLVSSHDGGWHVHLRAGGMPGQLQTITSGPGVTYRIVYRPLTDSTVHAASAAAGFPVQDLQAPLYVTSQVSVDDGAGGQQVTDYFYAGAKAHLQGYGMLGFRRVQSVNRQSGIETITSYRQDYPFTGMPERSESYLDGSLLASIENTWSAISGINGADDVQFPYISRSVERSYELPDESGNAGALVKSVQTDTVYDDYGNPLSIRIETTDAGGQVFGKLTTNRYDPPDLQHWVTDRVNRTEVVHSAPNVSAPHHQVSKTSAFTYYPAGQPGQFLVREEIIEPDAATGSPLYLKTTYAYDTFGNRTRVTATGLRGFDASSGMESRTMLTGYDSQGRFPVETTNALGHTETYAHDARSGAKTRLTGPNGLVTTWTYDAFGRKVQEWRPDGTRTGWSYDFCSPVDCPGGGYVETISASGSLPVRTYSDVLQRPVRTEKTSFTGRMIVQDTVYDGRGNVAGRTRPYFAGEIPEVTGFAYDALNRPVREEAPDGGIVEYRYSGFIRNTRRYHAGGDYDQFDTRINDVMEQLVLVVDAMNGSQGHVYDAAGNLVRTTDHAGNTIMNTYDLRGRKTGMDDPDMGHWEYRYNAFGELVWQRDAKGQVVTMVYDGLGRMIRRSEPEGVSTWNYDTASHGIGRLATVSYAASGHTRWYAYDYLGRLVGETQAIDGESFTMSYSYDGFSRRETVTYPSGFMVRNVHDGAGFLAGVRDAVNDTLYWQLDEDDAAGNITAETLGNGLQTVRAYHAAYGALTSISTGAGLNATVQNLAFEYDALGNLTSRTDLRQGYTENFSYDDLNRLRSAAVAGVGARSYTYDALGNITGKSDFGNGYGYGGNGAGPHAVTTVMQDGVTLANYAYDANGNMETGDGRSVAWTSFNKASSIRKGATTVSFAYDADHNRVKQVRDGHTTYYLGPRIDAGTHYEKELEQGKATHVHYIHAGSRSIAIHTQRDAATDKTRYLHTDHLGSTDAVTDEHGQVVERMSFAAFGSRRHAGWDNPGSVLTGVETHHGFTGHEQLDQVGLIHMNGRLYDPKLGRFLSPDIQVQYPDQTQSFNRYTYVNNNPLSFTDPGGYGFFSRLWKKVRKLVVAVAAIAVAIVAFQWGVVYFMSFQSAAMFSLTTAAFTYGALTGGWRKGIGYGLRALGLTGALSGVTGLARTAMAGLQSVMQKALSVSEAVEHVTRWAMHQYTQLKTRQEMERFAKRNGLSLFELNAGLGIVSWGGREFFGYDRLRLDGDASFGPGKDEPGIAGIFQNGIGNSVFDVADVALTFQGLPTAQGLALAAGCGGRVTADCLGGGYRGTLHGHSLGAAEVSMLKGLGLIDKAVGVNVYSLPFTRVAPGGVRVFQGSRDLVNLGVLGHVTNYGSRLVGQAAVNVSNMFDYHHCGAGYAVAGCGR